MPSLSYVIQQDYPEDELLLGYDRDFIYGSSFYLVLTADAKERHLKVSPFTTSILLFRRRKCFLKTVLCDILGEKRPYICIYDKGIVK